jgi:putative ABC transport system permease protein
MAIHSVDFDYAKVFELQMVQGRYFSEEFSTDVSEGIIVNETALKAMSLEEPIGTRFFCPMPFNMRSPCDTRSHCKGVQDIHLRFPL